MSKGIIIRIPNADFSSCAIGTVPPAPTPSTTYTISRNLSNCASSNSANSIAEGSTYSTTITANSGYKLDTVTCTMGGVSQSVVNGVINIASVSGNIVINASAIEDQPIPEYYADMTEAYYMDCRYADPMRGDAYYATGFLPVTSSQISVTITHVTAATQFMGYVFYDADKNAISLSNQHKFLDASSTAKYDSVETISVPSGAAYVRVTILKSTFDGRTFNFVG